MATRTRPVESEELRDDLPDCIGECHDKSTREVAEAIFDSLASMSEAIPAPFRLARCPSNNLNKKKAAVIFARIQEGYPFPFVQRKYNTSKVEFVGIAAGTLMAIRHGALNPTERSFFEQEFPKLVQAFSSEAVTAMPNRKLRLYKRFLAIIRQTIGEVANDDVEIKRSNGFWYQESVADGTRYIQAFGALSIDDHPTMPRKFSTSFW